MEKKLIAAIKAGKSDPVTIGRILAEKQGLMQLNFLPRENLLAFMTEFGFPDSYNSKIEEDISIRTFLRSKIGNQIQSPTSRSCMRCPLNMKCTKYKRILRPQDQLCTYYVILNLIEQCMSDLKQCESIEIHIDRITRIDKTEEYVVIPSGRALNFSPYKYALRSRETGRERALLPWIEKWINDPTTMINIMKIHKK